MREHSRQELGRKLAPHSADAEELDALLVELEQAGYLSDLRFAESLIRRRGQGRGAARVAMELQQSGVDPDLSGPLLQQLQQTELERAESAWARKFNGLPQSLAEKAKQQRYLLQRGFSAETISRLYRHLKQGV